jgi:transmembrane sensor
MSMDTHDTRRQIEARSIGEQAAEWLLALEDAGDRQREAFTAWMLESPLHVEAFLRAASMDTLLNRIDPGKSIPVDRTVVLGGPDIAPTAHPLPSIRGRRTNKPVLKYWAAAACVALVFSAALTFGWLPGMHSGEFATDVGEQRILELDDGSVLYMNTASQVQVKFSDTERRIDLTQGEAMFRVQRDPSRPFRVYTGTAVIQALGTQFNVHREQKGSVVAVLEGVVQITRGKQTLRLAAGQQTRIDNGEMATVIPADSSRIGAWRQRRLIFVNEPLSSIAAEFNRYNRTPQIRIEGSIGERRYAAAFDADDPESLLTVLEKDQSVRIERRVGELVIRSP